MLSLWLRVRVMAGAKRARASSGVSGVSMVSWVMVRAPRVRVGVRIRVSRVRSMVRVRVRVSRVRVFGFWAWG